MSIDIIREHAAIAAKHKIGTLPETAPAIGEALINPKATTKIFFNYLRVVKRMASLRPWELVAISNVNQNLNKPENRVHPEQGADMFVRELSKSIPPEKFVSTVASISDTNSLEYQGAMAQLSDWMNRAHEQKTEGVAMTDANPATHQVIMSQVNIPNPVENRATIQHVMICHGIERYLYRVLSNKGVKMAQTKDFFVNALADMIAFDQARFGENSKFNELYKLWSRSKDQGGLGWISQARVNYYRNEIEKQMVIKGASQWKKGSPIEEAAHNADPLRGTPYQSVLSIIRRKIDESGSMEKAREAIKRGELECPRTSYQLVDGELLENIIPFHVVEKDLAGLKRLFLLYIDKDGLIDSVQMDLLKGIHVREAMSNERYAGNPLLGIKYLSPKSQDGKLESNMRWIRLRGIGFGVAPAHVELGDVPAYYFVGDDQQYDPDVDKIHGLRRFPDDRIDGLKGNSEERLPTFSKQKITTTT